MPVQRVLILLAAVMAFVVVAPSVHGASPDDRTEAPQPEATGGQDPAEAPDLIPLRSEDPIAETQDAPQQLDDIVVTATKRSQPLREIPASINLVDGRELERQNAKELADFLKLTPGVTLNGLGMDQNRVTIRGIGADTSRLTTSQTAAILIGDTAFSDPMLSAVSPDVNPFDLEGVEILKGPQGTLFGSGGLSGAIRYVPTPPELGAWQGKFAGSYGTTREGEPSRAFDGAVNVPLGSDAAALRLVGMQRTVGGVTDDVTRELVDVDRRGQESGRALLRWELSNRISANAMYLRQRSRMDDLSFASNREGRLERTTTSGPSDQRSQFDLADVSLGYRFDWGQLTSTSSRVTKEFDSTAEVSRVLGAPTPDNSVRLADFQAVTSAMQELRLVSDPGEWEWLLGVYGLDYHQDFRELLTEKTPPLGTESSLLQADAALDLREISAFGNVARLFGDAFKAELGLRYYRVSTGGAVDSSGALVLASTGSQSNTNVADIAESGINPKVALSWFASRHLMSYVSVARGFRTGGIQTVGDTPTTDVPDVYKSDTLWNYEVGMRSDWFDRNLLVDLAVYYIDWKKPQMVQRTSDNLFNYVDNVGGARVPGAELSFRYAPPIDGLVVTGAAAYSRPRTTEPFNAPDGTPVPVGTPLPGTGDWQTALTLGYTRSLGHWLGDAQLVHAYTGPAYNDLLQHAQIYDYQTWDLRLTFRRDVGIGLPVTLGLLGTNLADERGVGNVVYTSETVQDVFYIRPRTVEMRVGIDFY